MSIESKATPKEDVFLPRYNLSDAEVTELSSELIQALPADYSDQFACFHFSSDDKYSNLGRIVETAVFEEAFGNDAEVMERIYGPYEASSSFFVVMDAKAKKPCGALRISENSSAGFMTLNEIARPDYLGISTEKFQHTHGVGTLDSCWDVGTVAVPAEYRRSSGAGYDISIMLYRALYVAARAQGIDHLVTILDKKARGGLRLLGVPFTAICDSGSFNYEGSENSKAMYGYTPEFYEKMEKQRENLGFLKARVIGPMLDKLMDGKDKKGNFDRTLLFQ